MVVPVVELLLVIQVLHARPSREDWVTIMDAGEGVDAEPADGNHGVLAILLSSATLTYLAG